jgi:hypothetical protein
VCWLCTCSAIRSAAESQPGSSSAVAATLSTSITASCEGEPVAKAGPSSSITSSYEGEPDSVASRSISVISARDGESVDTLVPCGAEMLPFCGAVASCTLPVSSFAVSLMS